jgi:mannose-6-phosphate isomerase
MLIFTQMWLGTHPSNPSYLISTGEYLGEYLKKNPQLVGKSVHNRWGPEIPFLPKASGYSTSL